MVREANVGKRLAWAKENVHDINLDDRIFRGCRRQPLYCFHLDFQSVTLVRYIYIYIYIYIYNMDLKKSLIIENLYNSNREV